MEKHRYVIISPVRNEAKNIEATITSMVGQSIKPLAWVIVDDGSNDKTPEIICRCVTGIHWITVITLPDRGYYDLMGGGEIRAFYRGLEKVQHLDFDFLGKLDGDIVLERSYYEELLGRFRENPRLGIAGGTCLHYEGAKLVVEKVYEKHVRGAARMYRKACWDAIGGVIDKLGWDAMDCYKARMLGWETRSFEDLRVIHLVKTWSKGGWLHGRRRSGRMEFLIGSHPAFFLLKVVRELKVKPYLLSTLALAGGYFIARCKREPRVADAELVRYIRREQLGRLLRKKP